MSVQDDCGDEGWPLISHSRRFPFVLAHATTSTQMSCKRARTRCLFQGFITKPFKFAQSHSKGRRTTRRNTGVELMRWTNDLVNYDW